VPSNGSAATAAPRAAQAAALGVPVLTVEQFLRWQPLQDGEGTDAA
jgi:hypothetical protein